MARSILSKYSAQDNLSANVYILSDPKASSMNRDLYKDYLRPYCAGALGEILEEEWEELIICNLTLNDDILVENLVTTVGRL